MEAVKVMEPRVNIKQDVEKNHIVLYGGMRTTEQVNVADSYNTSQALWTINPPSTHTITDRYFKIRCYLQITTDQDLQIGTNDGLRQFPLASITDVLTVQLNGESISDNLGDKAHAMLCYGNTRADRVKSWSMAPCMPDNFQQYNDWATYGSAKNPLADYGENNGEDPRGGFPIEVIDAKTFKVVVTEPFLMSPFYSGLGNQEEGFVNLDQINVSFRWKSDLSRVLAHSAGGNAITTVGVTFYQAPEILTTFITPDLTEPIPQLQVLPYHKAQDYIKSMSVLADNATVRVISDSIKLAQIPRRLYLFCKHSRATEDFKSSDSFLRIENLNILWNNQSGLFSSATGQDLYEISRRNGLNLSWTQWYKQRGGVMCIEFGKDIGLLDNEAPGVRGQYTVQIQMDVRNVSGANFTGDFYQVFMMDGTFSLAENMGRASLGNLTPSVVLSAKDAEEFPHSDFQQLEGGSFFSGMKNFVNKAARGIGSVAKTVAPIVGAVAPEMAPLLGAVGVGAELAKGLTGGRIVGGRLKGGRVMRRR